jgi:hypothetical protein
MISDEDLILYHYRDGLEPDERARIGAALGAQPELAQRLHRLVGKLDAAAAIPEVDVPEATQQRWQSALADAARRKTNVVALATVRRSRTSEWLAAAAVVLIALVVVLQINRQSPQLSAGATPALASTTQPGNASAYERGLSSHLANTEQQLASLESASPEERSRLVETIIDQNRIYALAAERAGEPQLARVLRAFSPVLESLKQEGADPTASVAQLAFEFRVTQGRLATGNASGPKSTTL